MTRDMIPLPTDEEYSLEGPIRQKMGRVLQYIIQKYAPMFGGTDDSEWQDYADCHRLIYGAWRRMNDDTEFCEQIELPLAPVELK